MHEAGAVVTELAHSLVRIARRPLVRVVSVIVVVMLIALLVAYRYSPKPAVVSCAFRISDSASLPETQGDAFRVNTCVQLEVASTNSARTLGLSGRRELARDRGMLFDFRQPGEYCMWMKDMYIDLDMIWLNEQKEIVHIVEDVAPDTYPKSFCGPNSAQYVVEVSSGAVRAADLRIGQRLKI